MVSICLGSLYGMENDFATTPNSHLSFIFKEKQKETVAARPQFDFLSGPMEENTGPSLPPETPLFASVGATGPAPTAVDTPLSLSSPSVSAPAALQHASGIMTFVKSHQNVLSTLFNPRIKGNEVEGPGIAFESKELDESQYIAQADINGKKQKSASFGKGRNQNKSEPNQLPSGTTRIAAHGSAKNDVWIDFFGEKLKFPSTSGFNTIHDTSLGVLVGYDRFISSGMLTGAVGYNHAKIVEVGHVGHGFQNQIFAIFQGTAYLPKRMYLGYSLYGSVNLNDFDRFVNTGRVIEVAESSYTSYTLDPHIDFGYDWCVNDWFIVEPFLSNDFLFNFQPSYSEEGAPGFNEHQDAINSGLYVVEPGVNLYQRLRRKWGLVVLRQEVGYERVQTMFGTENTASIINVQSGISTSTGLRDLNLLILGLQIFARSNRGFYGDVLYRGEWCTGMISNTLHLKAGYFF